MVIKLLVKINAAEAETLAKLIAKQQTINKLPNGVHLYGSLKVDICGEVITVGKWKA